MVQQNAGRRAAIYYRSHLAHHRAEHITHPLDDPESHYVSRDRGWRSRFAIWEGGLIARLILGPPIRIMTFLVDEMGRAWRHPRDWARDWVPHMFALWPILWWLNHVNLSITHYVCDCLRLSRHSADLVTLLCGTSG